MLWGETSNIKGINMIYISNKHKDSQQVTLSAAKKTASLLTTRINKNFVHDVSDNSSRKIKKEFIRLIVAKAYLCDSWAQLASSQIPGTDFIDINKIPDFKNRFSSHLKYKKRVEDWINENRNLLNSFPLQNDQSLLFKLLNDQSTSIPLPIYEDIDYTISEFEKEITNQDLVYLITCNELDFYTHIQGLFAEFGHSTGKRVGRRGTYKDYAHGFKAYYRCHLMSDNSLEIHIKELDPLIPTTNFLYEVFRDPNKFDEDYIHYGKQYIEYLGLALKEHGLYGKIILHCCCNEAIGKVYTFSEN